VRDHPAHVGSAKGEQRPVDEPRDREREDPNTEVVEGPGELPEADADEAEDRRLRDDTGEDGRDLGRRLAVGGGQPAVQREERRLDGEGDREAEEEPVATAWSHL